jgi:hypothetical protein
MTTIVDKWKVTLCRSPYKDNVSYWHTDKQSAHERAYTLAELHRCTVSVINASRHIYVHASAWYARKS